MDLREKNKLLGDLAEYVADTLWKMTRASRADNLNGIDRWIGREGVQIKADRPASKSGYVYYELHARKDGEWHAYGEAGSWYAKPNKSNAMIWVSAHRAFFAWQSEVRRIWSPSNIRHLRGYDTETTSGVLIPLSMLIHKEKWHGWALDDWDIDWYQGHTR